MQESDFLWFKEHCPDLFRKFGEKYIAIKNKSVIGVYNTYAEGVRSALKTEQAGTFIVQKCGEDESAYTEYINSILLTY